MIFELPNDAARRLESSEIVTAVRLWGGERKESWVSLRYNKIWRVDLVKMK